MTRIFISSEDLGTCLEILLRHRARQDVLPDDIRRNNRLSGARRCADNGVLAFTRILYQLPLVVAERQWNLYRLLLRQS